MMANRKYFKADAGLLTDYSQVAQPKFPSANRWPPTLHSAWFAQDCRMLAEFDQQLAKTLDEIKAQGLYKTERIITTPQDAHIAVAGGKRVLNLCANNYLGLADHPALIAAAKEALDTHGFGMASVRFICGTQDIHKELESALTKFLGTEETILYPSAFDANGGLFETILTDKDAVISDELNHASIIDGIRLCKAQRFRYKHNDMADLEAKLREASNAKVKLIATDGCFSMDGTIAELKSICDLADKYGALVMIDLQRCCQARARTSPALRQERARCASAFALSIVYWSIAERMANRSCRSTASLARLMDWV